jgi:tellurite resistance protein TerC
MFFPLVEYWWFYLLFTLFVLCILALDLGVFHREAHEVSIKEAAVWSVIWVLLALAFGAGLYFYCLNAFAGSERLLANPNFNPALAAKQTALEYLTGYIVEKSLAVDNIFVFVMIFTYFAIPAKYQHRILFYGIIGALIFRIIFISIGAVLMEYKWVVVLFGVFLILTAIKILFAPEKPIDPSKNPVLRLLKRFLPIWPHIEGQKFFMKQNGVLYATPLFVSLVMIEVSDIIFAVDSVPAIFAITKEPLIVFTSNMFAILGLRAMYFLLAGVVHKFRYLKYGLGLVLLFVGLKMVWLNEAFGGKFPITWSLGIISLVIGTSVALSLLIPEKEKASDTH